MDQADQTVVAYEAKQRALAEFAHLVNVGLKALSTKILTLAALLADAGLFGWAMVDGAWSKIAAAALFAIASWCLVNLKPKGNDQ